MLLRMSPLDREDLLCDTSNTVLNFLKIPTAAKYRTLPVAASQGK